MAKTNYLILFFILLVMGIILIPLTYFISNQVIYFKQVKLNVSSYSEFSIPIKPEYGTMIINGTINGYNGYVNLYLLNKPTLKEKYLGNFSGKINLATYDNGYTDLVIFGNLYPSEVDLSLTVYNSSFAATGYTLSALLLSIATILGFYSIKISTKNKKKKRYKKSS